MPTAQDTVEIVTQDGARQYRATVFAPDACHKVSEAAEIARDGDTAVITRVMIRDGDICATVMTPIEVTGPLPSGIGRLVLRLQNDLGRVVFDASATVPE